MTISTDRSTAGRSTGLVIGGRMVGLLRRSGSQGTGEDGRGRKALEESFLEAAMIAIARVHDIPGPVIAGMLSGCAIQPLARGLE